MSSVVQEDSHELMIELLQRELGSRYQNTKFFKDGGTRHCYIAEWGPGKQKRVIKVDKEELTSPRAQRHVGRGYNTWNEIEVLTGLPNPQRHGLMQILDFHDLREEEGITVAVEPHFESETLEERVEKEPLNLEEFGQTFSQVIGGVAYLVGEGLYHRDLKASNILVAGKAKDIEARITDFANACATGSVEQKVLPTAGGKDVLHPLLPGTFSKETSAYSQREEIYALGVNMYYALTGEKIFEFDADERTAIEVRTEESLLQEDGTLDQKLYERKLKKALKRIPRKARKFRDTIGRCLTLEEDRRFKTVRSLETDFERIASASSFYEHITSFDTLVPLVGIALIGAIGIVGIYSADQQIREEERKKILEEIDDPKKIQLAAEWDGAALEITNNIVEVSTVMYGKPRKGMWRDETDKTIRVDPGDKIDVTVLVRNLPQPKVEDYPPSTPPIPIKVYLEGFDGENLMQEGWVWPDSHSRVPSNYGMGSSWGFNPDLFLPEDLKPGVYSVIVEAYSPEAYDPNSSASVTRAKFMDLPEEAFMISRKRMPIVVGEVEHPLDLTTLDIGGLGSNSYVSSCHVDDKGGAAIVCNGVPKLGYVLEVPEVGWKRKIKEEDRPNYFGLPSCDIGTRATLKITQEKNGTWISTSFFPIYGRAIGEDICVWAYDIPGKEFQSRIAKLRDTD